MRASLIVAVVAAVLPAGTAALAASAPAPQPQPETAARSGTDAQITERVQAELSRDPDLRRVQVSTENGVVTLSGPVGSGTAAAQALSEARRASGVSEVRNRMRVVM